VPLVTRRRGTRRLYDQFTVQRRRQLDDGAARPRGLWMKSALWITWKPLGRHFRPHVRSESGIVPVSGAFPGAWGV